MIKAKHIYLCASLCLGPLSMALAQPNPVPAPAASAVATPASGSEAAAPQAAATTEAKPAVTSTASLLERQVPRLTLRWDCGDCEPNDKVFPLIEKTYADKAAAKGYTVSDAETADIVVTKYRQRPPATRVLFGFMAGKDILETRVTFRGTDFSAGDYSANAMQGMNFLCETVAQQSLDKLLVNLQSPAKAGTRQ